MVETEEEIESYKSGLTWRSFLALVFTSGMLMPAVIFGDLVTGVGVGSAGFMAIFLASEIARYAGAKLTRQELFIIWSQGGIAAGTTMAMGLIHSLYFRSLSPFSWSFYFGDTPLPLVVPDWYAPPPTSDIILFRTFFHPDWVLPIAITVIFTLTNTALSSVIGLISYELFAVGEKLPFPIAQVNAQVAITLSEREKSSYNILMITAFLTAIYAIFTYFLPYGFGFPQVIPVPWIDLTSSIEQSLPGATIGIGTSLLMLATGMMLPFNVVVNILIGSMGAALVGNPLLVSYGIMEWRPGQNIAWIYQQSILHFWVYPGIGLAIAAAALPLVFKFRTFAKAIKGMTKSIGTERESKIVSIKYLLIIFVVASTVNLAIVLQFTSFPWYYLVPLAYGWALLNPLFVARALGETGISVTVPYVNEFVIFSSGYANADIWFIMPSWSQGGGLAQTFKVCELTKTTIGSYLKSWYLLTPIAAILSFIFVEMFWKIAPIPSTAFPQTVISWPVGVINRALWITGKVTTGGSVELIGYAFVIGTAISAVNQFLHVPVSLISLATGLSTPLPNVIIIFIGGVLGKVLAKRWGVTEWAKGRSTIVAGMFLGQSLVLTLTVAVAVLLKSLWALPF